MKHASMFTVFYCTSIVLMLVLLHGCASTTHTQTTPAVPMMTTETHTVVEQLVKNPETGDYEMKVVSEEHTKTQSTMTGNNAFVPPHTPSAHANPGHSAGKTDVGFYALNVLIIAVNLYLMSH